MQRILDCFFDLGIKIQNLISMGETSYTTQTNHSGDIQLALDVRSDVMIEESLLQIPSVMAVASEEKEEIKTSGFDGEYCVAYDPIDGSSLLGSNLSVGTIFGIYSRELTGKNLVCSGYIVYGPRLELVLAKSGESGVEHYRYYPAQQKWEQQEKLMLKQSGKLNAPGGTQKFWNPKHKAMIDSLFADGYRLRYSGGMVPDLHQILIKGGGLFSYPATQDAPSGKLRKLFEVFPFALIFECAGGGAIDGEKRLLELEVEEIHQSCPCFFGSAEEIKLVKKTYGE